MALTKIPRGLLDTGIADSSDATAITIAANEDITLAGHLHMGSGKDITAPANLILDVVGDITLDADGGDVFIDDAGTRLLSISNAGSNNVQISTSISDGDLLFKGNDGGSIITALTLDMSDAGAAIFNSGHAVVSGATYATFRLEENDATDVNTSMFNSAGDFVITTSNDARSSTTDRLRLDHATGDIGFYKANGSAQALFWDASAESLGIGTTTPDLTLHVDGANGLPAASGTTPNGMLTLRDKTGGATHGLYMGVSNASPWGSWLQAADAGNLATEYPLFLNPNGGNVGIGVTTGIDGKLHVAGNAVVGNSSTTAFSSFTAGGLDVAVGSGTKAFQVWDDNVTGTPRFIVERGGNVGIGTGSPGAALHVYAATGDVGITIEAAEDNGAREPFLNLKSYATNANPVINFGDHAGYMGSIQYENQDDSMMFATNGSNHLYISSAGAVGIGGASAGDHLHVRDGSSSCNVRISGEGNINKKVQIGYDASVGAYVQAGSSGITTLRFYVDNTSYVSKFDSNGDFYSNDGTVHNLSDVRVKKDIAHLTDGLEIVKQLKPRTYKYTEDSEMYNEKSKDEVRYGFIANEVEEVASQYTKTGKGKVGNEEVEDFKSLSATKMIPMLVKAIQEQQALIETLQTKVAALESK